MMKERKQKGVGKVAFGCAEAPPLTDEEKAALRTCQRLCIGLVIFFACMIFIPVLISSPEVLMWMAIVVATLVGYRYRETLANIAYAVQIFVEGLFTLTYFFLYLACFVAFVAVVAVNIYWWVTGTGSYSDY